MVTKDHHVFFGHLIIMVFVLYSGKSGRVSAIIFPYLAKIIRQNKSNTSFLHEIFIIFSYLRLLEKQNAS